MSHVVTVETQLKDLEAVKRACKRLGWQFRENQKTYQWFGRWMDDSPVPEHFFDAIELKRLKALCPSARKAHMNTVLGKCDHAIRVTDAGYEIGLCKRGENYVPVWDAWHQGGLEKLANDGMAGFLQAYAIEKVKLEAESRGFVTITQPQANGDYLIRMVEV